MTDKMTDERLAEIRERWGNRWEYETSGGWRPVNLRHALNDTADLLAEVERLESSKLLAASMMAEQFCGEEIKRLREEIERLRERFADDEPTDHNITLHEDGYGYLYWARCSCGWSTTGYPLRANAEDAAWAHGREAA